MTKHTCRVLGCENPVDNRGDICDSCYYEYVKEEYRPRKLTRLEKLQELADSGVDTWEDYRGER